jgi:hypothetical protein
MHFAQVTRLSSRHRFRSRPSELPLPTSGTACSSTLRCRNLTRATITFPDEGERYRRDSKGAKPQKNDTHQPSTLEKRYYFVFHSATR